MYKRFISNAILGRKLYIDLTDDNIRLIESEITQSLIDIDKSNIEDDINFYSQIINIERQYGIKFVSSIVLVKKRSIGLTKLIKDLQGYMMRAHGIY